MHSSNEGNSQNTRRSRRQILRPLRGTVKSLYRLALHKIPLDGTFVRANIYKRYLLHSHARNSLITYK